MTLALGWPSRLVLLRHAESVGNLAGDVAEADGEALIDIATRDMDVPLSSTGEEQAARLGTWMARDAAPAVIYSSPYVRAAMTAHIACECAGCSTLVELDERLREREFGMLDRLTRRGVESRFPDEAEAWRRVGNFYYRPPGGESWCDVALRVRSLVETIGREHPGEYVVVVTHEVVVLMFRYVLERLSEADVLALGDAQELANCSITDYRLRTDLTPACLELLSFNKVPDDVPVTVEPDIPRAPR